MSDLLFSVFCVTMSVMAVAVTLVIAVCGYFFLRDLRRGVYASLLLLALAVPAGAQTPMATLVAERGAVGTPMTKPEIGSILNAAALKHGWFLLSKPNGNNCPLPVTGEPISCDWLVRPDGWGFDVLRDQEADGAVVGPQGEPGEHFAAERLVTPRGMAPGQPPPAPPIGIDLVPVRTWIDMARMDLYAQNERIFADLVARNNALVAQLEKHDNEPAFMMKLLGNRYVQMALAGAGAWFTAQQVK